MEATTTAYIDGKQVKVRYELPKSARVTPWGTFLPGANASGYGAKIVTGYFIQIDGEARWRRVYATCYSNSPTTWVVFNKKKLHVALFN